ncbi:bifunctional metallophosphatase/5'-nucleotidase [Kineococcus gynurae]|uniref:Bifunctional metallophosphatase/5'-nucleotidase n=1 Tax=Kineococcus gynurae TaxID=452979 RepID=A0ABV5LT90_9ACTN
MRRRLLPAAATIGVTVSMLGATGAGAATLPPDTVEGTLPVLLPAPEAGRTQIQIGSFNDFHGRLEAPDETDDGAPIGGAAQLAGLFDVMRADNDNTVVVSVGDNIGASTFTSFVQQDAPTIAALNAMDVAVSAVGNHEFDRGYADLVDRVGVEGTPGADGQPPLADFPYLGANVWLADTNTPAMPGFSTTTIDGVDVGFIGVVTEQTPSLVAPDGISRLRFTDPVAAANSVAAQLSDGNAANGEADVIVLLAHEGSAATDCATVGTEGAFGRIVRDTSPQVDAIISGHTHQLYDCEFPVAGKAVARPVISSQSYGVAAGQIQFDVDDATGEVVAQGHRVLPVQGFASDPEVAGIVDAAVASAAEVGARPVGSITADITRAFVGTGDDAEDDRGTQSPLANLVADAQLQQTEASGAQLALMNPGGVRDDLLFAASGGEGDGVVTYAEAAAVQPFANSIVTLSLTGAQVRQVLEEQWQPAGSSRPYLALGVSRGMQVNYDPAAPAGRRIGSVTLDGVELDPAATYRVTVNSFLAAGGDNFTTLAEGTDRTELGSTDLEVFTAYLGLPENQPLTPDLTPRSQVVAGGQPAPVPSDPPTSTAPAAPAPSTSPSSSSSAAAVAAGDLARTGAEPAPWLTVGAALVLAGGLLLLAARRRGVLRRH